MVFRDSSAPLSRGNKERPDVFAIRSKLAEWISAQGKVFNQEPFGTSAFCRKPIILLEELRTVVQVAEAQVQSSNHLPGHSAI